MGKGERMYRLTETGRRAWASPDSGLPAGYREVLGLLHCPARAEEVMARLPGHPRKQVWSWIEQLETLCFVESYVVTRLEDDERSRRLAA